MPSQTDADRDANPAADHPEKDYAETSDEVPVEEDAPVENAEDDVADSDAQLAKDEDEAIDKDNIIKDRTRHAKPEGGYKEPGDEEDIPAE